MYLVARTSSDTAGLSAAIVSEIQPLGRDVRIAADFFAQKKFSIVLDTYMLREQDHVEVSPLEARLPLRSPKAAFVEAKLRIER